MLTCSVFFALETAALETKHDRIGCRTPQRSRSYAGQPIRWPNCSRRTTTLAMRPIDHDSVRWSRQRASSIRFDLPVLTFLLFATAAFVVLRGTVAHTQESQARRVYRIGFLRAGQPPNAWVEGFRQGLRERGYVEGQNVVIEFRVTDASPDQLPFLAEELLRSKVDVVVASAAPAALAIKRATTSVPIVFVGVNDPVGLGLVSSLGRPAGNVTGLATTSAALAGKRLELLKEAVPKLRRVAVLWDPSNPTNPAQLRDAEEAARTLGLQTQPVPVRGPSEFDSAYKTMRGTDGLLRLDSPLFTTHRARLAGLAASSRLPTVSGLRDMAELGDLMSYGVDFPDLFRRAAAHVEKILKGAKPSDLPVEQPTKFEIVINLRTAKTLGLTIPQSLLLRADQVIE
jgi:putative tryptophan/tyrosine transport system substrate-binding protein